MSADDFQTKYASVMESMLKSAVAETTKLFETMVDELKAEISKIKKENEDLKTRCSQFESAGSQPTVDTRESDPLRGRSDGSKKRDTAVQCDLVPLRMMLVEQCPPLRESSLQNQAQQCGYEEKEYALQDHNYESQGERNSQMTFILVKQEAVLKQEEVESTVVCGHVMSDKADSTWASSCGTENEGPFIDKVCSTREIAVPQRHEETRMALELPILGMCSGLQGDQSQSSELGHTFVISLAAIKDDLEEEVGQKISEIGIQGELRTSEKHQLLVAQHHSEVESPLVVPKQCQREGETSVNKQTDISLKQYADVQDTQEQLAQPTSVNEEEGDELKKDVSEIEPCSKPVFSMSVRRRRGRPPKTEKYQLVKEILQSPSSDITTEQEVKKSPTIRVEEVEVSSAVDTVNTPSSESPQTCPVQPRESSSISSLALSVASESQQCSMDMEEGAIQAPSTEVSSAVETLNTPPSKSTQASVEPREHHTPVTLQDAMLFVEAMNQSIEENKFSSPQKMTAPVRTECAPHVGEVPVKPQTLPLPAETHDGIGKLPITELREKHVDPPQTKDATPTIETQAHTVCLSNTTSSVPSSTAATETSMQSLQPPHPHSLTTAAPSKLGNAIPHKIIVVPRSSSLKSLKIAEQSSTQPPTVVPTVVATQNNSRLPGSTAAGLPLGIPSLSSVPQKTIDVTSSKSPTVDTSQSTTVASRKHQSQTIVPTPNQESTKSAALDTVSLSQELKVSVDTQTVLDAVATISSQKRHNTSDNLESPKQPDAISETTNAHTVTCSSLNMSVELLPTSMSPAVPPTSEQKLTAVVRLTRLPYTVLTQKSVLVSRLQTNGYSDPQSILKEASTKEKLSSFGISSQTSQTLKLSTDICPSLKETSVAVSVHTSDKSEEPNDIQKKASLSSENCTTLEQSPNGGHVQPPTPFKMSQPVFEKSTLTITTTEPSAVPGTASEPTSNLDEEMIRIAVQDCEVPIDRPIEEKKSAALLHLTSLISKDTADPHSQMTKAQFLAQLAVSPVEQDSTKASSNDSVDDSASCAETSTSDKKTLQKNSLMAQLRSHIKTHFQAKRTVTNPEPHTETETCSVSPKKPRLDTDYSNDENTTIKPVEDVTSLKQITNDPTPISHRKSGLYKDGVKPKSSVSESSVGYQRSQAVSESTRSSSGRHGISSKNIKSTPSLTKHRATPKKTTNTSVRPRRTCATKDGLSPKIGSSPNNTITIPLTTKKTSSSKDGVGPQMTKSTSVSPRTNKIGSRPKMSTNESTSVCRRRCTFTKDGSSTKPIKRESNALGPRRCSINTDGASTKNTKSETDSPSARWPTLSKDDVTPRKTRESTSVKKPRLLQDFTSPRHTLNVVNAQKLNLQNGAKTSQLAENRASCEAGRKFTAKAVWTPPIMPAAKTPPAGGKKSVHSPEKKETRSQDHTVVYPPSVSLHPIPVKAPPVVSPLQPLSVIGRRLLKNQCGECGRVLSSSAALESHVSLHKGRRPFSCTLCGKRFPDSKGLKRHGRVHRNGRIHVCQQCGKGFVYGFGLTKHLQMVHRRIKPFVCQICNKGFFTKLDVEAHIRMHTGEKPFHCNLCEKKFARRVELNVHLRWHNGEKRHWCPYCGKGFLDFNNLKRHKYIHTGEKPHSCPHCPKHFTQSGHLKKHVKNVHKIQ
ncbi:mucin-5AC [Dicentrarchus labrax]|uniref:mucin-5AC n=1 Tax=Dicentrarchus labrax TaxID=13489 RepID=UPI0021F58AE7|nr:mucin-5AC [Dicentrarchus labrax]